MKEEQKFGRWEWISYDYVTPKDDRRKESQKVISNTLVAGGKIKPAERAGFLAPLVRSSLDQADELRESLALIRPASLKIEAIPKSLDELSAETAKHRLLSDQLSLLEEDENVEPLVPCRMQFVAHWKDEQGKIHRQECDDWETSAAFNRFDRMYGEEKALRSLKEKYEEKYFEAGLVLGFSTHSRRNVEHGAKNQWLLVGMIRLDRLDQFSLL
ncbi:MAG: hypothetical protein IH997_00595 [Proteobacteria bacterium]|nr:hypothetical protein [Pseudomonadota bacterium]